MISILTQILLQTTVALSVAALAAWCLFRVFRCRSAAAHQFVWGTVLALGLIGMRIVVPVEVAKPETTEIPQPAESLAMDRPMLFRIGEAPQSVLPIAEPAPSVKKTPELPTRQEPEAIASGPPREPTPLAVQPEAIASGSITPFRPHVIIALWALGFAFQSFRHVFRYVRLRRVLCRAVPVDTETQALWTEMLDQADVDERRRPAVKMLPEIGPALIETPRGYTLVLSQSHWDELDENLRRGVLRHELSHFLQGDVRRLLFARIVVLLHWFNPMAHLAARRFEEAVEWSADVYSYGKEERGLERFAAAMLTLHETTPQRLRYRVAFGSDDIVRRLDFLKSFRNHGDEPAWKVFGIFLLASLLLIMGSLRIHVVAREKKADVAQNIVIMSDAEYRLEYGGPLTSFVDALVTCIEKENLKDEKLREKIGGDAKDEFLQSIAEEMLRLKRSHAAVEIVKLMRDTGKRDKALLSIARRQLFAAFRQSRADTSLFHKALDTAWLISDETVRDNMRSLVLLHFTKCVGFERMNQPKRFERDKKLAMLLAMHVIESPENPADRAEGIWSVSGRQGSYVVNQYSEKTPEPTLPGFTFKEKSELIDKIVRELKDPFDRGLVHESLAHALKIRISPDWKDEYKKTAEDDARWRLTEAKVEYRKSDKPEAKKRLENIDELFDKLELVRTEIEPGKYVVGVQNYSPEHRPIHLATGNPNAATAMPDTIPDRMAQSDFSASSYDDAEKKTVELPFQKPKVDERLELVCIVARLAGFHEFRCKDFTKYNDAIEKHFADFKDHEVIRYAKFLRDPMWGIQLGQDRVVVFGTICSIENGHVVCGDEAIDRMIEYYRKRKYLPWTKQTAKKFARLLDDFYVQSRFHEFFQSQRPLYEKAELRFAELLGNSSVQREGGKWDISLDFAWFDRFFGKKFTDGFRMIPLMASEDGGFEISTDFLPSDDPQVPFSLISVGGVDDEGNADFLSTLEISVLQYVSQPFAQPLIEKHYDALKPAAERLLPLVSDRIIPGINKYPGMPTDMAARYMLSRYLVYAALIKWNRDHGQNDNATSLIHYTQRAGYLWMDKLLDLLDRYDKERDRYPTMDDFMPEIVRLQDSVVTEDFVRELKKNIDELKREKRKIADADRPRIVSTRPTNGAKDVDPGTTEISVTFDRPMAEGMAWYTRDGNKTYPERTSKELPVWSDDKRTCTMRGVALKPGKTYNIWFNTEEELDSNIPGDGFRSSEDIPLRPVHFTFATKAAEEKGEMAE